MTTTTFAPTEGYEVATAVKERVIKFTLIASIAVVYMILIPVSAFGGI